MVINIYLHSFPVSSSLTKITTLLPGNHNSLELVWFVQGMRKDGAAQHLQPLSKQNNPCSSALDFYLLPRAANPETAKGIQR